MHIWSLLIKIFKYLLLSSITLLLILSTIGAAFVWLSPVFGGKPDNTSQTKITQSTHFNGETFENLTPTKISTRTEDSPSTWDFLKGFIFGVEGKNPSAPVPSQSLNGVLLQDGEMIWFGHSTVLMATNGLSVITDPVFYRASPLPIGGAPFELQAPITTEQLPPIDVVLISHDHYDHLDMQAVKDMAKQVKHFIVPLGIKAHLQHWGINSNKITELDWYESKTINDVNFILAPSRHFSGRGLTDRMKTLWGSWIVNAPALKVYFSGDGGYSSEFKKIGSTYGPFDLAIMENGAYDQNWAQIHMFPEQTIKASEELKASYLLPVHWGKYDLANHHWLAPIQRLSKAAKHSEVRLVTPIIGKPFTLNEKTNQTWWAD